MRRLIIAALVAAASTVGLTAPSSATSISLSAPGVVRLVSGCSNYSVRYAVPAAYDWDLTITVKKPNGALEDSTYVMQGVDPATGAQSFQICPGSTQPGRYVISASYEARNSDYETIATASTTRSMSIAKSNSKTKLRTTKKSLRLGKAIRFRGTSVAAGQRIGYANIVLKGKLPGKKWRTIERTTTSGNGVYAMLTEGTPRRGLYKFKLCTKAGDWHTASCSKVSRVRVR